jgi:xanthosine utilization system XapX-like protein
MRDRGRFALTRIGSWFLCQRPLGMGSAIFLLVLAWLILCRPWFWGGRTVPWDSKDFYYPHLYFVSQSLRAGDSPFWNPHTYGGYPEASDPQSMIFSPVALGLMLARDKPSIRWFDGIELFHLLLGAWGMLFLSVRLGRSVMAGSFAALVYMFGGSAAARMEHVAPIFAYCYFPFALLTLHLALDSKRLRWAVACGVVAGIMAAHENQVAYLFCLVLVGYVLYRAASSESFLGFFAARWRVLAVAILAGAAVLAVPLYLTLQFLPLSNRPQIPYETAAWASLHPLIFLTLFVRNFFGNSGLYFFWGFNDITESYMYVGMLPIVLIARYGVPTGALLERRFRFFLAVGLLAFLYAIGRFTPFYWLAYHVVPGVNLYRRPTDATFVIVMVLALATGFLMDRLLAGEPGRVRLPFLLAEAAALIPLFSWGIYYAWQRGKMKHVLREFSLALLLAAIALGLLYAITRVRSEQARRTLALLGLVLLAVDLGLYNAGTRLNASDPSEYSVLVDGLAGRDPLARFLSSGLDLEHRAGGPYRAEIVYAGSPWRNAPMVLGMDATLGFGPLRYVLYDQVAGAPENDTLPRPFTPMMPGYHSTLVNLLGVKYIVSAQQLVNLDPHADEEHFPRVYDDREKIMVWLNSGALPRVLTATTVHLEPNLRRAIAEGKMAPVDYRSAVVLERLPSTLVAIGPDQHDEVPLPGQGAVSAGLLAYRNTEVTVGVQADRDVILVLNDPYYPYWRVYVDGRERELLQANYLFRGVHVKAGERRVVFRFEPFSWPAMKGTVARFWQRPER